MVFLKNSKQFSQIRYLLEIFLSFPSFGFFSWGWGNGINFLIIFIQWEKKKGIFKALVSRPWNFSSSLFSFSSLLSFVIPVSSIYKILVPVPIYLVFVLSGLFLVFPPTHPSHYVPLAPEADCIFKDRWMHLKWQKDHDPLSPNLSIPIWNLTEV